MTLSSTEMALIFAGCVVTIGVVVVLWRRRVSSPPVGAQAAPGGDVAK